MIVGYTKLSSSILTSSLWNYDHATVRVWITILALMNPDGTVMTNHLSLARAANVTQEECDKALSLFLSPDPLSRSFGEPTVSRGEHGEPGSHSAVFGEPTVSRGEHGERLTVITGGWRVVNADRYRSQRDPAARREQTAKATRKWRKSKLKPTSEHREPTVSRGEPKQNINININTQTPRGGDPDINIQSTKRAENPPPLGNDIVVGRDESGTRLLPGITLAAAGVFPVAAARAPATMAVPSQSLEDSLSATQVSAGHTGGLSPAKPDLEPTGEAPKFARGDTPYDRMVKARKERERSAAESGRIGQLGSSKYDPSKGVGDGAQSDAPVPSSQMPEWWLTACDVVEMASGVQLDRPVAWLRYSGHRSANAKPMGQSDAQYWLTSVDVADARKSRERERASKDNYAASRERRFAGPEKYVMTDAEKAASVASTVQAILGGKKRAAT